MTFSENWTVINFYVFPDGKYISSLWVGDWTREQENAKLEVSAKQSEDVISIF